MSFISLEIGAALIPSAGRFSVAGWRFHKELEFELGGFGEDYVRCGGED